MTAPTVPALYSSVNTPLVWVFYDANAINPVYTDYKYVAEVWVAGVKVHTERSYPRPVGAFGIFDFAGVIRNYVNPVLAPSLPGGAMVQQSDAGTFRSAGVVINVREEYNGTVGAVVFTDSTRYFYNHYNDRRDGFTAIAAYANKPLTTRGRNIDVYIPGSGNADYYLPYFATSLTPFNVTVQGVTQVVTPTVINSVQLLNMTPGFVDGLSYTATINGEVYNINTVCKGLYRNYKLHFLNKFGSFESMLFNKPSKRTIDIDRKSYRKKEFNVSAAGVVSLLTGEIRNEQGIQYATRYEEKLRLQTDLISDTDYQWLSQLIVSPMVFLEDNGYEYPENRTHYPVTIKASNYEYKEWIVDRLTNLTVDLEFSGAVNVQYR